MAEDARSRNISRSHIPCGLRDLTRPYPGFSLQDKVDGHQKDPFTPWLSPVTTPLVTPDPRSVLIELSSPEILALYTSHMVHTGSATHSLAVAHIVGEFMGHVGRTIPFSEQSERTLILAAVLHDTGKLDNQFHFGVTMNPDRLTEQDRKAYLARHVIRGVELLHWQLQGDLRQLTPDETSLLAYVAGHHGFDGYYSNVGQELITRGLFSFQDVMMYRIAMEMVRQTRSSQQLSRLMEHPHQSFQLWIERAVGTQLLILADVTSALLEKREYKAGMSMQEVIGVTTRMLQEKTASSLMRIYHDWAVYADRTVGSPSYPALLMQHLIAIERSVMNHPMYQRIRDGFSSN
ncbi:MAG: HD domain-containing protein [Candidatus Dojkabacteria bacterium]